MAAYVLVNIEIHDAARYERYRQIAAPTVAQYGGRYLARGGTAELLEGSVSPKRVVVLEFPTLERARAWWNSPEYAPAKAIRQSCATTDMIVVEGAPPP